MARDLTVEISLLDQMRLEVTAEASLTRAIALFRLSYERAVAARRPDGGNEAP